MDRSFIQIKEIHADKISIQDVKINSKKPCHQGLKIINKTNKNVKKEKNICDSPVDSTGNTRLMLAAAEGQLDHMKYFIQRQNASINTQNYNGDSPLTVAIKSQTTSIFTKVAVVQFLYNHGSNLQLSNIDGDTPLHTAVLCSLPIISNLLLQNGAFLETENNDGLTPLMLAVKQNDTDNAKLLISWGADTSRIQRNNAISINHFIEEHSNRSPVVIQSKKVKEETMEKRGTKRRACGTAIAMEDRRNKRKLVESGGGSASSLWWM
eukprot:TRINITY_DN1901_c0_g2_i3.p1 TRINITY_DN1901_c0_g2~~TRINITY_DN1901_c0_g2_i3.p1  ORF type:complete len:266 (-),score=46.82 TRINITY_DN1901_c0_g2_i3:123-920(-)